jgi:hypothetical protein
LFAVRVAARHSSPPLEFYRFSRLTDSRIKSNFQ